MEPSTAERYPVARNGVMFDFEPRGGSLFIYYPIPQTN
jgi:hypothetical protein